MKLDNAIPPHARNKLIQILAKFMPFRQGVVARFLHPTNEVHDLLFGKYKLNMNLSLGRLQKIFFLKPDLYEFETQEALRTLIKSGMTVFDIGANSGFFSLLMANLVGPAGRVYSFEPFPVNFRLLKKNILSNGLAQVHLFQVHCRASGGKPFSISTPLTMGAFAR